MMVVELVIRQEEQTYEQKQMSGDQMQIEEIEWLERRQEVERDQNTKREEVELKEVESKWLEVRQEGQIGGRTRVFLLE